MPRKSAKAAKAESINRRVPPSWGQPLNEKDYEELARSWINPEIADEAMIRRVNASEGRDVVGQRDRDCSGTLFSYYWPGEPGPHTYRIRRDNPEFKYDKDGNPKPDKKYLGAPKSANRLYIPPSVTSDLISDASIPIVIVEGEKKALAIWRLAHHDTEELRFIPVALGGAWNWRGTIGKAGGPKGERLDVKGPIADLNRIEWNHRKVFIIFDSNAHTNESVKWARKGIANELTKRGAEVQLINLPEDCGVNGIDDLLAAWGPERVLELFKSAIFGARLDVVPPPQFRSTPEGIFRFTSQGDRMSRIQLTNFNASIITNVQLDDGVETSREFEIEAEIVGRRASFTIAASEFLKMNWPIEQLGAAAIIFPNQKDYARAAMQSFSLTATEKRIFVHTGWRHVDGPPVYLHAGGAVGAAGAVPGTSVRLMGTLSRYQLRLPTTPTDLQGAVKASLRLIELGPPPVSFPLLAATIRAVFGAADFALHVVGETGAYKSELAALHQQFFGAAMDRRHLPGSWSSTGNALEAMAFHAKDTLIVIDDFTAGQQCRHRAAPCWSR